MVNYKFVMLGISRGYITCTTILLIQNASIEIEKTYRIPNSSYFNTSY